jgi:hypothetical protein
MSLAVFAIITHLYKKIIERFYHLWAKLSIQYGKKQDFSKNNTENTKFLGKAFLL